jgi:hypothetical protein
MKRTNLLELLEDYQNGNLYTEGTHGGGKTKSVSESQAEDSEKSKLLVLELRSVIKNNADWLKYIYAILTALLVLLSIFLWRKQDDMTFFFAILGGQGATILFCINRLSYFYRQKRGSEILLHLYQTADSQQAKNKVLKEIIAFLKQNR